MSHQGSPKNIGCHSFLQGIFLTRGLNPGLPHCRQTLYHLRHQGSPIFCLNQLDLGSSPLKVLSDMIPASHPLLKCAQLHKEVKYTRPWVHDDVRPGIWVCTEGSGQGGRGSLARPLSGAHQNHSLPQKSGRRRRLEPSRKDRPR